MRGYFGIGVESISKPMNVGSLFRSAHAFGAAFVFAIQPSVDVKAMQRSDTSDTWKHVPLFEFPDVATLELPKDCALVGVELLDESIDLPSFTHPERAAYVLGPERGSLSPALVARCAHVVKIPMDFCINLGVAGAIVMYDRMLSRRRFADRPVMPGGGRTASTPHRHGPRKLRRKPPGAET